MIEREESMVERVAKAIRDASTQDDWTRAAARAAIEAMREPTEAMMEAVDCGGRKRGWLSGKMRESNWCAMIDAALKEGS